MDVLIFFKLGICIAYYHIGGMATTNILRLCKGNEISVLRADCRCPECNASIPWYLQLPVISYIVCKGKCRSCGCQIPKDGLILEIAVMSIMIFFSALCDFGPEGVLLSFGVYEIIKLICVIHYGKREKHYYREYLFSVLQNVIPFLLIQVIACLHLLMK